ncbi:MAG: NUDIX hydrolase [Kiritimatiellia bacterium]
MEDGPRLTTLCYLEKDGCYLILHRAKKEHDENGDKWIGVGGKFELGESPEECVLREVKEETGLTLLNPKFRGLVTFVSDEWGVEYMHLFTGTEFTGELIDCDEGELTWLPKEELLTKKMWAGDRIFLKALDERTDFFSLKLVYAGETLVEAKMR